MTLPKSIGIVNDRFAVTGNHVTHSKISHQANTLGKVLALSLLERDGNKVLVGLELDVLSPAQMNVKNMLLVGGLRMQQLESAEQTRQVSTSHAVEVIDSLTLDFEKIWTNTERGTGNVRHVTSHVGANVHVQA
jgi:hypothetical protein